MFLALRDLRVARGRFVLIGSVIALVALMSTLLSGLATGLVNDGISGLRALPISHLVFQRGAGSSFSRSVLGPEELRVFERAPNLRATPIGVSFVNASADSGSSVDLALFGVDPGGFLAEESAGAGPDAQHSPLNGGLVLSDRLRDEVEVGDELEILGTDRKLPVVGFTFGGTYGHVPIAYTSLATWQELVYGRDARGRFSAIALQTDGPVDLAALDAEAGTETVTRTQAFNGSPGYAAETATMTLIRGFLLVISAMVVGAFFTVWTVQRTRQIGLLKAMGASNWYVVRDAMGQLAVVLAASILIGTFVGLLLGSLVGEDVPFSLAARSVTASSLALGIASMAGSLVAIRRLTRVDPAISLSVEA